MAIVRICAEEVTSVTTTFVQGLIYNDPEHTPVAAGTQAKLAVYNTALNLAVTPPQFCFSYDWELEYAYLNQGTTFLEFCHSLGNSACVDLQEGVKLCTCGINPSYTATTSISVMDVTTNSVSGNMAIDISISDLCVPTTFCLDTVTCPI